MTVGSGLVQARSGRMQRQMQRMQQERPGTIQERMRLSRDSRKTGQMKRLSEDCEDGMIGCAAPTPPESHFPPKGAVG